MMITNWRNPLISMVYTQIVSALRVKGLIILFCTPGVEECTGGAVWTDCGISQGSCWTNCTRRVVPGRCTMECYIGCLCPDDLLMHEGVCITHDKCPGKKHPSPPPQQTLGVGPLLLVWCWASVVDGGPTSSQHWVNVACLLGQSRIIHGPSITVHTRLMTTF